MTWLDWTLRLWPVAMVGLLLVWRWMRRRANQEALDSMVEQALEREAAMERSREAGRVARGRP